MQTLTCPKCNAQNRIPENYAPGQRAICGNCKVALTLPAPADEAIPPAAATGGSLHIVGSLLSRARAGDQQALVTIFRQFLPEEENIYWTEYLGFHGWLFGRHSFGCLTERRVADVTIGHFGEVIYQDGYLEAVNSGVIYQPSKLALYVWVFVAIMISLGLGLYIGLLFGALKNSMPLGIMLGLVLGVLFGLLIVNMAVRFYYATHKCGLVMWIKEGVPVYVFSDRKRLRQAHAMFRMATEIRDQRISTLGQIG